ncbi:hypothetical protein KKC65_00365 [Patescibacteria group bacterium]|nr:hypothetical protein [Patescibacteria group bacterium]
MNIVINTNYKESTTKTCLYQLGKKFSQAGHSVVYGDWENYQNYDVILFMSYDPEIEKAKKDNPKAMVGVLSSKLVSERHIKQARTADFLIVDSIEVRDLAWRYNKNVFIYFMFPEIDFLPKQHFKKEKIIIGYHGNKVHLSNANSFKKALDKLSEKYNIEFWAIYNIDKLGKWKFNLPEKCPVKHIQWSESCYHEYLSKVDIGVCPGKTYINEFTSKLLARSLINFLTNSIRYSKTDYIIRFKYAINPGRIYPFSQLNIPVVADFMPSYGQIIQDGKSGFLAYSKEGWYYALEQLILSSELRQKMSDNLREYIDNNCSPDINFKKFVKFVNSL